jgi:hypothetical protein
MPGRLWRSVCFGLCLFVGELGPNIYQNFRNLLQEKAVETIYGSDLKLAVSQRVKRNRFYY